MGKRFKWVDGCLEIVLIAAAAVISASSIWAGCMLGLREDMPVRITLVGPGIPLAVYGAPPGGCPKRCRYLTEEEVKNRTGCMDWAEPDEEMVFPDDPNSHSYYRKKPAVTHGNQSPAVTGSNNVINYK